MHRFFFVTNKYPQIKKWNPAEIEPIPPKQNRKKKKQKTEVIES